MPNRLDVKVDEQYRVIMDDEGKLYALRFDLPWRDLVGDNLVYCLSSELEKARAEIERLKGSPSQS